MTMHVNRAPAQTNSSSAALDYLNRFPAAAVARLRWRIEHPSPDEIALAAMRELMPLLGGAEDPDIPGTAAAVLAVAERKRAKLEDAYWRLLDDD
jgi:hypothetical protein